MNEQLVLRGEGPYPGSEELDAFREPLREAVRRQHIPGAAAAVKWPGGRLLYTVGSATADVPVTARTLYDCASLTKVVVTLPLILLLAARGALRLDDPARNYLPEIRQPFTVRQLLAHCSGLPAWRDLYTSPQPPRSQLAEWLGNMELQTAPGSRVVYSDLGYMVLGILAERLLGSSLAEAASGVLFRPGGMPNSLFTPSKARLSDIAATEYLAAEKTRLRGVVHDENARALGGVSGHAGLFSTADDLLRYLTLWLEPSGKRPEWLHAGAVSESLACHSPASSPHRRGLGWVLRRDPLDAAGQLLSEDAFSHTGFTGTSLCVDPRHHMAAVLLTNRVYYGRAHSIAPLRTAFHDAIAASILHLP